MKLLPAKHDEHEIQLTSFVDVVFTLLAFFVLASSFSPLEKDFALGYEQRNLAPGAKKGDFPENVLIQLRRSEGGVAIVVGQGKLPDNDFRAIQAKLAEINMPDMGVILAAEGSLNVDVLARAMDAVLASPMKKVSIAPLVVSQAAAGGGESGIAVADRVRVEAP